MTDYKVSEKISIHLTHPDYAESMFNLIQQNRDYLSRWLPNTNKIKDIEYYKSIINIILKRYAETKTGAYVIKYEGIVIGSADLQLSDSDNKIVGLGYWIDENYQGKGIIHNTLKILLEYAFINLDMHKAVIVCVEENTASRNVAKKLEFYQEATFIKEFLLNGQYHNLIRYSMLKDSYKIN